jgi:hypothetical protein
LFCTSHFLPKNETDVNLLKQQYSKILEKLDDAASKVLAKSLMQKNSQTIIVTNAQRFWVYYSAEQLAPKTYEIIRKRIPVVSAR